jgi:hypothetical protein
MAESGSCRSARRSGAVDPEPPFDVSIRRSAMYDDEMPVVRLMHMPEQHYI